MNDNGFYRLEDINLLGVYEESLGCFRRRLIKPEQHHRERSPSNATPRSSWKIHGTTWKRRRKSSQSSHSRRHLLSIKFTITSIIATKSVGLDIKKEEKKEQG